MKLKTYDPVLLILGTYDYLQIYVDGKVIIDKTCGHTIGKMLGATSQAAGKFGWGKRTTVSVGGKDYIVQDPTEVKIKGKRIKKQGLAI